MIDLVLTAREREELRLVLESCLADLSFEIARTDGYDFRLGLKQRRTVLRGVLDNLTQASSLVHPA
ncbi:MAG TPA: hypothetical protein VMI34_24500 [Candidatus Bathyarchaeia archaeon]|nr:hypothetical protein [Candidatus Bathyarchaeia archaeon]